MASNTTLFTALPTEEEEIVRNEHSSEEKDPDQILDGLLTKVGYGLFQKKLLVKIKRPSTKLFFCLMFYILNIHDRFYVVLDG